MSTSQAFTPGGTVSAISGAGVSSAATAIPLPSGQRQVRVLNAGTGLAFIRFGGASVVAAATDMPVRAASDDIFSIGGSVTHFAVFGVAAETLYVTSGHGE